MLANNRNLLVLVCLFSLTIGYISAPGNVPAQNEAAPADDGKLTAIGGLAAGYVYNSYIAIGAIGDGFGKDVYTPEQVQSLTNDIVNMMDVVKKQILGVQPNVAKADQVFIDDVFDVLGLLQEQARQLNKFSQSRTNADFQAYDKARTKVWPKIQKLLGIEEAPKQ